MREAVPIDAASLIRLYVEEQLSAPDVALKLGCSAATVLRRLRQSGIDVRHRGPAPRDPRDGTPIRWSSEIAYACGLMATDGNLSRRKGQMSFVSKDVDQVEALRHCLRLSARIVRAPSSKGFHHKVQWNDRRLYDWFVDLGLAPAKSRALGQLAVPDEFFADFFRGCVDGDGSVTVYTDRSHPTKKPHYVYERLYTSLVSASLPFLDWMRDRLSRALGLTGAIHVDRSARSPVWTLRYAKAESIRLIGWMYHSPNVPALARKRLKAERFLAPLGQTSSRPVGRPGAGWLYTVRVAEK
jgi:hypothetical protein